MGREFLRKILAVMVIITLMTADFLALGVSLVSYAADLNKETNNNNIEFSTYFKNAAGEKVDNIVESTDKEDLKLYAEITVKTEGYFNGAIELLEGNFTFKNTVLSKEISKIEGNKITLNQINAGNTVEIEVGILPISSEEIQPDQLTMNSKIKLTGKYMETSYKGKDIEAEKTVNLKLNAQENTEIELNSEVIANKVYKINEENKRIVQILVKSRITNNNYPVKETTIKAAIPEVNKENLEEVKIVSMGTKATNGAEDISTQQWDKSSSEVQMKTENIGDKIIWKKGVYDEYIITYIYKEETAVNGMEFKIATENQIYNKEAKITKEITTSVEEEINKTIVSEIKNLQGDLYKGQLYANTKTENKKEIAFNTTTKLIVRTNDIAEAIKIKEEKNMFVTATGELNANTRFVMTKINKEKMLKLLGEDGNIQIRYGNINYKITKDSVTDENGDVVINYDVQTEEIEIETTKPISEGILEFNHEREIMVNTYTLEQVKTITGIKTKNTISGILNSQIVTENLTEQVKELKETYTKAELTINKANLSTISANSEVALGVRLVTNGTQYDLYKNPTIKIQLPEEVKEVKANGVNKLYGDEFTVSKAVYNKADKTIEIELDGEQKAYAESEATQLYLQINLDIVLEQTSASKTEKITMTYTNENAIQYYENGTVEKEIGISAPSGIVAINNLNTYNINSVAGISNDKQIAKLTKDTAAGIDVEYQISVVNNTGNKINNVKILGYFPTKGDIQQGEEKITNTLETSVAQAINGGNAQVYYSENSNATADLSNASNGWTQDTSKIASAKTYLIELGDMEIGSSFTTGYTSKLANELDYNLTSYAGYKVLYSDEGISLEAKSNLVGLSIEERQGQQTPIEEDQTGGNTNNNNDQKANITISLSSPNSDQEIYPGDTIEYYIEIKNESNTEQLVDLVDEIPEYLEIMEIKDGRDITIQQSFDENEELTYIPEIINSLFIGGINIEAHKSEVIKIRTEVRNITEAFNKIKITNKAQVMINDEVKDTSVEINHTIKSLNPQIDDGSGDNTGGEEKPDVTEENKSIVSGLAWLDENKDGKRDSNEKALSGISVKLLDAKTNKITTDKDGKIAETTTGEDGTYIFKRINEGEYIVIFDYDSINYEPTSYMQEGVSENLTSKVLAKTVTIDGEIKAHAVTDKINLGESAFNINIGLKETPKYDLESGKYISKITVQNKKGTKIYECNDDTFKKIEINSKQIEGSVVVLEYTIRVKNTGEIAGYVTNIRDYLPSELTFSSELNPDWYLSGQDLYTKSLENVRIEPGETKEVKLVLTKTMTSNNVGLINNRAEIAGSYNEYGKLDIDSTENNQANGEDDIGSADVIIGVSTGLKTAIYTILIIINISLIACTIYLVFRKNKIKEEEVL